MADETAVPTDAATTAAQVAADAPQVEQDVQKTASDIKADAPAVEADVAKAANDAGLVEIELKHRHVTANVEEIVNGIKTTVDKVYEGVVKVPAAIAEDLLRRDAAYQQYKEDLNTGKSLVINAGNIDAAGK